MNWLNNFFLLLKNIISILVIIGIVYGGYYFYNKFRDATQIVSGGIEKVGEVASDVGAVMSGGATAHGADLGGACNVGADCKGFRSALSKQGGVACCHGKCTNTRKDYAGIWWCPHECRGRFGAASGTCPLKENGQSCSTHVDCKNHTSLGVKGVACCRGTCKPLKRDWAGVWYCPHECRGGAFSGSGTCK